MIRELLNPIGEVDTPAIKLAPRLVTLKGKVMGILDNRMGQSTALLEAIGDRLAARFEVAGRQIKKRAAQTAAETAEELRSRCDFVVAGFGCSGVYTLWCVQCAVELEKRGVPTVMVCTKGLDSMCQAEAKLMGLASMPLLSVPLAEESWFDPKALREAADRLMGEVVLALMQPADKVAAEFAQRDLVGEAEQQVTRPRNLFSTESLEGTTEEATNLFYEKGWTDGLPIVAPTNEAVEKMLAFGDRSPDEIIAYLRPRAGKATVHKIAVNAVMAGCLPEYLPVIITAVQAMAEPQFNLSAMQATTNPVAPLTIVNGPLAKELVINSGFNVFGQGWRANATIGRAIRLILMNIGGGLPGTTDKAGQGQPAKYTFCIAENEDESPWEPLHVERGFPANASTVTVAGVQANHNFSVLDRTPETILAFSADAMSVMGTNSMFHNGRWPILALNPQAASILARSGYSKADVKRYMFEHAVVPLSRFPLAARKHIGSEQVITDAAGEAVVRATGPMEDIIVIVTGIGGAHSQYLATMGDFIEPVTKAISFGDGTPLRSIQDLRRKTRMWEDTT